MGRGAQRTFRVETAFQGPLAVDTEHPHRLGEPLERMVPEVGVGEQLAGQLLCRFGDDHGVGGCNGLQARGEVRRLAHDHLL